MAKQPTIPMPLDLPNVEVRSTTTTKERTLLIEVESTLTTTTCRRCGQEISQVHGYDRPLTLHHLPILGTPVFIRPKRFRCPFCDDHPTTTQRLSWYEPNAAATRAFVKHLLIQLVQSMIADGAMKEGITDETVLGVVTRWMETTGNWASIPSCAILGLDEIVLKSGSSTGDPVEPIMNVVTTATELFYRYTNNPASVLAVIDMLARLCCTWVVVERTRCAPWGF